MTLGQSANSAALGLAPPTSDRRDGASDGVLLPMESGRQALEPNQISPVLHGEFVGADNGERKGRGSFYSMPDAARLINLGRSGPARVNATYALGTAHSGQLGRHVDILV